MGNLQDKIKNPRTDRNIDIGNVTNTTTTPCPPSTLKYCRFLEKGVEKTNALGAEYAFTPWFEPNHPKRLFFSFTPDISDKEYNPKTDVIVGIIYHASEYGINEIACVCFANCSEVNDSSKWKFIASDDIKQGASYIGYKRILDNKPTYIMNKLNIPNPIFCDQPLNAPNDCSGWQVGVGYAPWRGLEVRHWGFRPGYALRSFSFQSRVDGDPNRFRMCYVETEWEQVERTTTFNRKNDNIIEAVVGTTPKISNPSKPLYNLFQYEAKDGCFLSQIGWIWGSNSDNHSNSKWIQALLGVGNIYTINSLYVLPKLRYDKDISVATSTFKTAARTDQGFIKYETSWKVEKEKESGNVPVKSRRSVLPDPSFIYPVPTSTPSCKISVSSYLDHFSETIINNTTDRLVTGAGYNPALAIEYNSATLLSENTELLNASLSIPTYVTILPDPEKAGPQYYKIGAANVDSTVITAIYYYPLIENNVEIGIAAIGGVAIAYIDDIYNSAQWAYICCQECQTDLTLSNSRILQKLPSPIGLLLPSTRPRLIVAGNMEGSALACVKMQQSKIPGYPMRSAEFIFVDYKNNSKNTSFVSPTTSETSPHVITFGEKLDFYINCFQCIWSKKQANSSIPDKYFGIGQIIGCSSGRSTSFKPIEIPEKLKVSPENNTTVLLVTLSPEDPSFLLCYFPLVASRIYGWCSAYKTNGGTKPLDQDKLSRLWYSDLSAYSYLPKILSVHAKYLLDTWDDIPCYRTELPLIQENSPKELILGFEAGMKEATLFNSTLTESTITVTDIELIQKIAVSGAYTSNVLNGIIEKSKLSKATYDFSIYPIPLNLALEYRMKHAAFGTSSQSTALDTTKLMVVVVPSYCTPKSGEAKECILSKDDNGITLPPPYKDLKELLGTKSVSRIILPYKSFSTEPTPTKRKNVLMLLPNSSILYLKTYFSSAYDVLLGMYGGMLSTNIDKTKNKTIAEVSNDTRSKLWKTTITKVIVKKKGFTTELINELINKPINILSEKWFKDLSKKTEKQITTLTPTDSITHGFKAGRLLGKTGAPTVVPLSITDDGKASQSLEYIFGCMLAYYGFKSQIKPSILYTNSKFIPKLFDPLLLTYASKYARMMYEDPESVDLYELPLNKKDDIIRFLETYEPKDEIFKTFYSEWKKKKFVLLWRGISDISSNQKEESSFLISKGIKIPVIAIKSTKKTWPVLTDTTIKGLIDILEYPKDTNQSNRLFMHHLRHASNAYLHPNIHNCPCDNEECLHLNF